MEQKDINIKLTPALEALLFVYGEAIEIKKAARILEVEPKEVEDAAAKLAENLKEEKRGLSLLALGSKLQLVSKREYASYLETCVKDEMKEQLTPASLETLALVAYLGPLTRPEIEYYRGVNSTFTLRSLVMRGLIERVEGEENAGQYRISMDLLKYLGISSIEELPEFETIKNLSKTPPPEEMKEL